MALSVCFALKNSFFGACCLKDLPRHDFLDDSTYYALAEYFHGPRFVIGIDPYDGGYLQDNDLQDLIQLVELAGKEIATKPEQWVAWTSLISKNGENVKLEHRALKQNVEMTLKALDEMARHALKDDLALLFIGD